MSTTNSSRTEVSDNCKKRASKLKLRLMGIGAQVHMQTIPAAPPLAPLLAPLSGQSSPSSSFFLDQTIDAAGKQSHKNYKLKDISSLSWLDNGEDEVDELSIGEGRPPTKSHWSDDSDVNKDEDVDDQVDDESGFGESVTSATNVNAKDQEADGQAFGVGVKEDMAAAVVLEETGSEEAELSGNTHAGNACHRNRVSRKDETISQAIRNDVREHRQR